MNYEYELRSFHKYSSKKKKHTQAALLIYYVTIFIKSFLVTIFIQYHSIVKFLIKIQRYEFLVDFCCFHLFAYGIADEWRRSSDFFNQ